MADRLVTVAFPRDVVENRDPCQSAFRRDIRRQQIAQETQTGQVSLSQTQSAGSQRKPSPSFTTWPMGRIVRGSDFPSLKEH